MKVELDIGEWSKFEPRCTGAWLAKRSGPANAHPHDDLWHARCPVCDHDFSAQDPDEAIQAASAHCSRANLRAEIEALKLQLRGRSMSSCYFCLAKPGARHVVDCPAADGDPWAGETKPDAVSPKALHDVDISLPEPKLATSHGTWTLKGSTWVKDIP